MSNKRAVIVGINNYPSAPLRGCVNDAMNISEMLSLHFNFENKDKQILIDHEATTRNIMDALNWLVDGAKAGDVLFFHFSGHGSRVLHTGDDVEANGYDEILCPFDLDWKSRMIKDDDLREIFDRVPTGVNLTVVLDCCHSGTALDHTMQYQPLGEASGMQSREFAEEFGGDTPHTSRMMPAPPELTVPDEMVDPKKQAGQRSLKNQHNYAGLLISGCQAHQTSADAWINNKFCGAATNALMVSMKRHNYRVSFKTAVEEMNQFMVHRRFTQRPELDYGNEQLLNNIILRKQNETRNIDNEKITNMYQVPPASNKQTIACIIGCIVAITGVAWCFM